MEKRDSAGREGMGYKRGKLNRSYFKDEKPLEASPQKSVITWHTFWKNSTGCCTEHSLSLSGSGNSTAAEAGVIQVGGMRTGQMSLLLVWLWHEQEGGMDGDSVQRWCMLFSVHCSQANFNCPTAEVHVPESTLSLPAQHWGNTPKRSLSAFLIHAVSALLLWSGTHYTFRKKNLWAHTMRNEL